MTISVRNILVVEDEVKIATLVRDYLQREGFKVTVLHDGSQVYAELDKNPPVMLVLDLMLPGHDGLTICRNIRRHSTLPIVLLTARVDEQDRLDGFKAGADDYICKPFSAPELVARVHSILRRTDLAESTAGANSNERAANAHATYGYADITLDIQQTVCAVGGVEVILTPIEFRLLQELMTKPGIVFSRYQLMRAIYLDHRIVSDRTIDSHVSKLRRKLGKQPDGNEYIYAAYSMGYKLC